MNIKLFPEKLSFLFLLIVLFILFVFQTASAADLKDIEFFKGRWIIKLRGNTAQSFNWTLDADLNGAWLAGSVETNGKKISRDFWRVKNSEIERFAYTADGMFVRVESIGWKDDKLVFEGTASSGTGETKIRETITRVNKNLFYALWEIQETDGKWRTLSDEICTRETK